MLFVPARFNPLAFHARTGARARGCQEIQEMDRRVRRAVVKPNPYTYCTYRSAYTAICCTVEHEALLALIRQRR